MLQYLEQHALQCLTCMRGLFFFHWFNSNTNCRPCKCNNLNVVNYAPAQDQPFQCDATILYDWHLESFGRGALCLTLFEWSSRRHAICVLMPLCVDNFW